MSQFIFTPAVRENVPLLIGLCGGTGSGKTYTALAMAKGMAGGKRFALIDTESGRGKHYADQFQYDYCELRPPFRPAAYADAIESAQQYPVVIVDSMSHEYAGEGGMLDWHDELMGGQESKKMTAWIKPKMEHKRMVQRLLQVRCHVILCFRAEEKVEVTRNGGRMEVVAKKGLTALDGWWPVTEKNLPFELTTSLLFTADAPGVPKPIKLQEQHRQFFPLNRPVTGDAGAAMAAWARGGGPATAVSPPTGARAEVMAKCTEAGITPAQLVDLAREWGFEGADGKANAWPDSVYALILGQWDKLVKIHTNRIAPEPQMADRDLM